MKQQHGRLFYSKVLTQVRGVTSAALVGLVAISLAGSPLYARDQSTGDNNSNEAQPPRQVEQILQLLANFHGALSYGGNITAMMNLWADDSSISLNGVSHVGKDAVQAFFLSGGYFHNNWVSLAPEYKTQITIDGDRAQATTQCVAIDLSTTPYVVRGVIQVNAVAQRVQGKWVFVSMDNTTPAPL